MSGLPSLELLLLLSARALPTAALLPSSAGTQPLLQKTALAFGLACTAALAAGAGSAELSCRALAGELVIGAVLALPCALTVEAAALFGELLDAGRGENYASFYDPLLGDRSSSLALLGRSYCLTLLLLAGTAEALLAAFNATVRLYPPGAGGLLLEQRGLRVLELASAYFLGAAWFYLPCAVLFLAIEGCAAAAARLSPRLAVMQESFVVKTYAAFGVLLVLNESGARGELAALARPITMLLGAADG